MIAERHLERRRAELWHAAVAVGVCALGLILAGCTASHYQRSADKEAYRVIAQKTPLVTNMPASFSIDQTNRLSLADLPLAAQTNEFLGPTAAAEPAAHVVTLEKSLEIAVHHSRTYQNSKEQLYLAALALTLARHQFTPLFSGSGRGDYAVQTEQALALIPDPANPGQYKTILSDQLAEKHSVHGSGTIGVNWLLRDLGRLSVAFTTDFLRFLSGGPSTVTSSEVGATLSRPLLRNAGYKADLENLTQAERSLLYALRDFVRFRKDFTVQIASAYYGVLGNRDAARNAFLSLQSSRRSADRTRALAAEGRATQSDLGRLEQQELSSESAWISAVRNYERSLDDFKIQLGIPIETKIVLDDHELTALQIRHPDIKVEDAIQVALAARLDYQNLRDESDDSARKTKLAADRLKPQVDLVGTASIASPQQDHGFAVPDPQRYRWDAGLNVDLGLDRKAERNDYRSALISEERARRACEQRRDEIYQQIRDSWRTLEQARRNYEISEIGVNLAARRVEEQELLAELGRAKALDQVDAQNALLSSKDQRTQSLVAHTIARLQFWNNLGILFIQENGQWEETKDANTK